MKITEIGSRKCSIGKNTITVYDSDGSFAGIVRNIERCGREMPMRKRFDIFDKYHIDMLTESKCLLADGQLYYIVNDRSVRFYESLSPAHMENLKYDYWNLLDGIKRAESYGLPVLHLNYA